MNAAADGRKTSCGDTDIRRSAVSSAYDPYTEALPLTALRPLLLIRTVASPNPTLRNAGPPRRSTGDSAPCHRAAVTDAPQKFRNWPFNRYSPIDLVRSPPNV